MSQSEEGVRGQSQGSPPEDEVLGDREGGALLPVLVQNGQSPGLDSWSAHLRLESGRCLGYWLLAMKEMRDETSSTTK